MIGLLRGHLLEKDLKQVLVEVGGIAYEVDVPLSTSCNLPEVGAEVALHTHLVVREDAQLLFGFGCKEEREAFRALIKVNGVGPRLALAVLSGLDAASLARAIQTSDVKALSRVPGVGKRTAERIVIEMKDRLPAFAASLPTDVPAAPADKAADAEAALIGLGYKPQDAARAIALAEKDLEGASEDEEAPDVETLIRLALKNLMKT